ncbi:MAG: hypothetical protein LBQ09_09450 [Acidobacteriaceae bacterium]|nr:hypothetical protein [Acidobacteriaceae bacterium]
MHEGRTGTPQIAASHHRRSAVGALVVAMMSFQCGAAIAKQLIPSIGASGTTALRVGLAAVMVFAIQRPWRAWPTATRGRRSSPTGCRSAR